VDRKETCKVLIVDDDILLSSAMSQYFSSEGISTSVASDGQKALQLFAEVKPDVVVADLRMPVMDGLVFLENLKKNGPTAPVIITTGNPDMASAIRALQNGAFDYMLKPLHLPVLLQKIRKALEASRLSRENIILSEIVSLYNITSKLAASSNIDALLDVIFRYGLELTGAPAGAIYLLGGTGDELVYARQRWLASQNNSTSAEEETARCSIADWTVTTGKSVIIEKGVVKPEAAAAIRHAACARIHSLIAAPLAVSGKTIGVLLVERDETLPIFSVIDFNRMEIIASHAGIAISNAELCVSLNKRLEALKLISTFSERISGSMDRYRLLQSLFEKVREHCAVDFIGFLLVQKRMPEFCYWSRYLLDEADIWGVCRSAIEYFNGQASRKINERRVSLKNLFRQQNAVSGTFVPFVFKHFMPITGEEGLMGIFCAGAYTKRPEQNEAENIITGLVGQIRIALINAQLYDEMKQNYLKTIRALAIAVDAKDNYTSGHSEKVMAIAEEIAREMGECDDRNVAVIRDAALLHDIGKIGIPGHILNKPGALSFDEFNGVMKKHSAVGANIVKDVPFLSELYELILHHHEHFDGTGYPAGLKGDNIPLGARILHVADAYDAMTSDRPYRSSLGQKEAIRRIVADSGKHFDPGVVGVLLRVARRKGIIE
jgi:putative nucleotidyltransferase with HDIG domain